MDPVTTLLQSGPGGLIAAVMLWLLVRAQNRSAELESSYQAQIKDLHREMLNRDDQADATLASVVADARNPKRRASVTNEVA